LSLSRLICGHCGASESLYLRGWDTWAILVLRKDGTRCREHVFNRQQDVRCPACYEEWRETIERLMRSLQEEEENNGEPDE
jgi:hypothetical protein